MTNIIAEESATLTAVDSDALLVVLGDTGNDPSGTVDLWPDIKQLIEMMALKGELYPSKMFWIQMEGKYLLFLIANSDDDYAPGMGELAGIIQALNIRSVNIPVGHHLTNAISSERRLDDVEFHLCKGKRN